MDYRIVYVDELYHHGIKGQKWGKRNGPPYPLDSGSHSTREVKANWRSSLSRKTKGPSGSKSSKSKIANDVLRHTGSKNVRDISVSEGIDARRVLGLTDDEAKRLKKIAKVAGISLATSAGIVAAGYLLTRNTTGASRIILDPGYNVASTRRAFAVKLNGGLFSEATNGSSFIGDTASKNGWKTISSEYVQNAIKNAKITSAYDQFVKDVRLNQVDTVGGATRRLSCWSAANSYYMSSLTGHQFASKNFQNLVDFNEFGRLYKTPPKIFNAFGKQSKDFVGAWGKGRKAGILEACTLSKSILKNIDSAANLTKDGSRTIGFINAAYNSTTCTHQWNFEVVHQSKKVKDLIITDGYSGVRFFVGRKTKSGVIKFDAEGLIKMARNLRHYNAGSIRFYAPSLDSIDPEIMAKVILGRP